MSKNKLEKILNRKLPPTSFARNVGVLAGGTVVAQAITVLAMPLITRLYTPVDFSVLAVYSSSIAIIAVVACLRLEIAIPLPLHDEDAANLLGLSLASCSLISLLSTLIILIFEDSIVNIVGQPSLRSLLWAIPLGIWATSAYSAIQFWATRKKRFASIAKTRISQALGATSMQLTMGIWPGAGALGLVLGHLLAIGTGVLGLARSIFRFDLIVLKKINKSTVIRTLREYSNFPKYSTIEALTNSAATEVPVIIIAANSIGSEAGYLFLAMKIMAVPIGFVGSAISQVFFSHASEELRSGRLDSFTLSTLDSLVKTGVGPLIFSSIVAPVVFPFIFGWQWQRAGEMIVWMAPWFIFQILSSPISMALHVTKNQNKAMWLQIFGLIFRVGMTMIAVVYSHAFIFEIYSATGFVFYIIYLWIILKVVGVHPVKFIGVLINRMNLLLAWIFSGIAVVVFLNSLAKS